MGKVFKHLIVGNINLILYYKIARIIEDMLLDEINCFFYEYGFLEHNDETREKYYYYSRLVPIDDLKLILIRNGLFEVKEELKFREHVKPNSYIIEKKEGLTDLGRLFADFGFKARYYLKNPIE